MIRTPDEPSLAIARNPQGDRRLTVDVHDVLSDPERLRVLGLTGLMDSAPDQALDRWTKVAAEALAAPIATISLVDGERQFFASQIGLTGTVSERGSPLASSVCQYVVADGVPLAVADARLDEALKDNGSIAGMGLVAYAGAPIVVSGQPLGALCVIALEPRAWSDADVRLLTELAQGLAYEIELGVATAALVHGHELVEASNRIHELIAADCPLPTILGAIVASIETHDSDLYGSILLLDEEAGTLGNGVAPRLPAAFMDAVDGLPIGPTRAGSCGAAAFSGQEVISHDLRTDTRWDDFRDLVEPLGLRHCWSFPVIGAGGGVLGTFGVYGARPRSPSAEDRRFLGDAARLAGIAIDRRRGHDRLVYAATHDSLTGLLDRATGLAVLDDLLARREGENDAVAVLFVDLDRLKLINDTLGHDAGDQIIREVARRLLSSVDDDDIVARLGGEEFLIILVGDVDRAAGLAERALTTLRAPLGGLPDGRGHTVTASIGIAIVADDGADAREALRRADAAMYAAKARGGNAYAWSDDSGSVSTIRRLLVETALRRVIERDELSLVYQPVRAFDDGRPIAVEALLRWAHPELGVVAPDEFVPIAEQSGLINDIGAWVLRTACAAVGSLMEQYGPAIRLGVNVSAQQLRDPHLVDLFALTLAEHGLTADRVSIEITESALLATDPVTTETVRALDAMGARIVLDDFGTGYFSLATLKHHPIKAIKIDRSFVVGVPEDRENLAIVTSLIVMGQGLGLKVVAEGIDSQAEYDALRALGCDYAQGYLLGGPEPAGSRQDPAPRAILR